MPTTSVATSNLTAGSAVQGLSSMDTEISISGCKIWQL
ncbi:hypothetical protein FHS10_003584 [Mucilaginibacter dorajii]|nr:hypothetical protein [Mucilaginibacter dorajii]